MERAFHQVSSPFVVQQHRFITSVGSGPAGAVGLATQAHMDAVGDIMDEPVQSIFSLCPSSSLCPLYTAHLDFTHSVTTQTAEI